VADQAQHAFLSHDSSVPYPGGSLASAATSSHLSRVQPGLGKSFCRAPFCDGVVPQLLFLPRILIRRGRYSVTVATGIVALLIFLFEQAGCDPESEARCDLPIHLPAELTFGCIGFQ
jgi:hypothetical protein